MANEKLNEGILSRVISHALSYLIFTAVLYGNSLWCPFYSWENRGLREVENSPSKCRVRTKSVFLMCPWKCFPLSNWVVFFSDNISSTCKITRLNYLDSVVNTSPYGCPQFFEHCFDSAQWYKSCLVQVKLQKTRNKRQANTPHMNISQNHTNLHFPAHLTLGYEWFQCCYQMHLYEKHWFELSCSIIVQV